MAQAEDTELRDLVFEALEKNGSLAKIRALLRANIFLIFEDDCENIKQNVNLDGLLKLPEGIFCLSIIHEFLEFCNLKNTLFVYMSESRQGKDYSYEGHNSLFEKLKLSKRNKDKEPILITLIKNVLQQQSKSFGHNVKRNDKNFNEEQNNTYIVHEDSTSSISHSTDNSSDEKNKLHLRLQLDNSDTDTSSDSTRGKTSSEYIPSEHIVITNESPHKITAAETDKSHNKENIVASLHGTELNKNSSNSDSTSYVDIKPLSPLEKILINTAGVPSPEEKSTTNSVKSHIKTDMTTTVTKLISNNKSDKHKTDGSMDDLTEYSLNFTSPPSGKKESVTGELKSLQSIHDHFIEKSPYNHKDQHDQKSISSQSSISISEAADINDVSNTSLQKKIEKSVSNNSKSKSQSNYSKYNLINNNKSLEDSGDFSESPIPSLSNLSLDIHSD